MSKYKWDKQMSSIYNDFLNERLKIKLNCQQTLITSLTICLEFLGTFCIIEFILLKNGIPLTSETLSYGAIGWVLLLLLIDIPVRVLLRIPDKYHEENLEEQLRESLTNKPLTASEHQMLLDELTYQEKCDEKKDTDLFFTFINLFLTAASSFNIFSDTNTRQKTLFLVIIFAVACFAVFKYCQTYLNTQKNQRQIIYRVLLTTEKKNGELENDPKN
ncbi:hypothetical protein [Streptococcus sp. sy010]|uniref:hypothetical protein n=1 Tax=Streptococcus sp. sy010 TaxID=2600148 RepID=UPI0011B6DE95|nr:hypothetical protein [Streptococcus sp. sy010]TWT16284.1 hypothetical protein FRX51_03085 [Streptococcus sp. sy010]